MRPVKNIVAARQGLSRLFAFRYVRRIKYPAPWRRKAVERQIDGIGLEPYGLLFMSKMGALDEIALRQQTCLEMCESISH
jgi:hypothetical protein